MNADDTDLKLMGFSDLCYPCLSVAACSELICGCMPPRLSVAACREFICGGMLRVYLWLSSACLSSMLVRAKGPSQRHQARKKLDCKLDSARLRSRLSVWQV